MDLTDMDWNDPNVVAQHLAWLLSQITGDQSQEVIVQKMHQVVLSAPALGPGKKHWRFYIDQNNDLDQLAIQNYDNSGITDVLITQDNGDSEFLHKLTVHGDAAFLSPVTVPEPTITNHVATKNYVDTRSSYTVNAGTGLTKTDNTISINSTQPTITSLGTLSVLDVDGDSTFTGAVTVPSPTNATDAGRKDYIDGLSYLTAGTGLTKTDSTLSVNASQTQITTLGTLTGLVSSGVVFITNTTDTTNAITGALQVAGGTGISGSIYIGKNLNVTGTSNFTGTVTVPVPVNSTDAGRKDYIDGLTYLTAGTGLTKVGATISVNAAQTQITSVGTLTGLSSSGVVSITDTTSATDATTGAFKVAGGAGISGSLFVGANLNVTGTTNFTGKVTVPATVNSTDAGRKDYIDALTYLTAGTGLTKTGSTLSVDAAQTQITAVGTLTGLTSSGIVSITSTASASSATSGALKVAGGVGIAGSLYVGTNLSVTGTTSLTGTVTVPVPANATDAGRKDYIDGLSYLTAGTGLTKTGSTLSVNAAQTQITSVGTLTGLTSSGVVSVTSTASSNSTTSGALQIAGGTGISGSLYVGTNLNVSGTANFGGTVTVPVPANGTDAGRKDYIDGLTYLTAGTGLTKAGSTLSVNAAQTQITSVGTLTGLTSSGVISITNTTAANNVTSGALQVSGGAGISGSLYVGNSANVVVPGTGYTTGMTIFQPSMATNFSTTVKIGVSDTAYNCGSVSFAYVGAGSTSNYLKLQISNQQSGLAIKGDGTVICESATDASSATSAALQVTGGLGVAKSIYTAGTFVASVAGTSTIVPAKFFSPNITSTFTAIEVGRSSSDYDSARLYFNYNGANSVTNTLGLGLWNAPQGIKIDGTGVVYVPVTTDSSSTSTGALQVAGGVGISKSVQVGQTLTVNGNTYIRVNVDRGLKIENDNAAGVVSLLGHDFMNSGGAYRKIRMIGSSLEFHVGNNTAYPALQLTYGVDQTVNQVVVPCTVDSASATTGAFQVAGGMHLGKTLHMSVNGAGAQPPAIIMEAPASAVFGTAMLLSTNASNNTQWGLYHAGSTGTGGLLSGCLGFYSFSITKHILQLKQDGTVQVAVTTDSTSTSSGVLQVSGGVGIAKSLWVGSAGSSARFMNDSPWGQVKVAHTTASGEASIGFYSNTTFGTAAGDNTWVIGRNVYGSTGGVFGIANSASGLVTTWATDGTVSVAKSINVNGGLLNLQNGTSNTITFSNIGLAPPTKTTRSPGTRMSFWNDLNTTNMTEHAIGVDSAALWYSISTPIDCFHKWYAGTDNIMSLSGAGDLTVTKSVSAPVVKSSGTGGLYYKAYDVSGLTYIPTPNMSREMLNGRFLAEGIITTLNMANLNFAGQGTNWSIRIMGYIKPLYTETYTFYMAADENAVLWVNNVKIGTGAYPVNDVSMVALSTTIALKANVWVPIYIEWYQSGGGSTLHLQWSSTSQTQADIPSSSLSYNQFDNVPSTLGTTFANGPVTTNDRLITNGKVQQYGLYENWQATTVPSNPGITAEANLHVTEAALEAYGLSPGATFSNLAQNAKIIRGTVTYNGITYPTLHQGTYTVTGTLAGMWMSNWNGSYVQMGFGYSILRNGSPLPLQMITWSGSLVGNGYFGITWTITPTVAVLDGDAIIPTLNAPWVNASTFTMDANITEWTISGLPLMNAWDLTSDGFSFYPSSTQTNTLKSSGTGITTNSSFYPSQDNVQSLGFSTNRWTTVYATNGTIQTSDVTLKNNIRPLNLGLDFVKKLKPIEYEMHIPHDSSEVENENGTLRQQHRSENRHMGLSAQEVLKALEDTSLDAKFAGVERASDGTLMMNYSQFIAPLVKAVQELDNKYDARDAMNATESEQVMKLNAEIDELKAELRKNAESIKYLKRMMQDKPN